MVLTSSRVVFTCSEMFCELRMGGGVMQDGGEVFFRIKSTATLRKLMNAYCDRQSVDPSSIAFLFDGRRLRADQTPAELDMEDGDEIDAMLHQTGGACCC